ncbi:MAG: hypothetical protein HOK52_13520 [Candidatus Marinimicrobia bacterium]|jgi:hypothetical protein|nr:hypothetical protein [Candidatus Neomarinimicrobiota bacterium]MBT3936011.1 hypothetical protein [Candidatus Neomarinimicrobiota bacterium]MBT3960545.1 hypothetical protein [Candidatus Neomarinimicrobiota bacterium]MBT4383708.1 hypothetical protein [Candidatus Neomarinimicrobiota bacterium]MBT4636266.1 hypothetical protein [Candidatus Neomarinimicrobiota bacterium]
MFQHFKPWIAIGLFIFTCLYGQVISTIDTLKYNSNQNLFKLNHTFIIDSSLINISHQKINIDSVNNVKGLIFITDSISSEEIHIFSYSYLLNPPPLLVQPDLHPFETGAKTSLKSLEEENTIHKQNQNNMQSAGTFFRQLNMTQKGGSEFSGGMKFQLQGNINETIQLSGFISDQEFPLQPEGNSQKLGEIDQVFLQLSHPNTLLEVGDIDYSRHTGKFQHYDRKLIGIKNHFKRGDINVESILSTTKSRFRKTEFKGKDGMQGPYQLASENGNIDIIIQAGTEKVWLNGQQLVRGKNHDYVVDYQAGEISFTAKQLIHHDSDIYIEYQYTDYHYNRNLLGASYSKNINDKGNISFHLVKEDDFISSDKSELSSDVLSALEQSGDNDLYLNGISVDSTGEYYLAQSILYYLYENDTTFTENYERVSAVFYYNENGNYIKKISDKGNSYYQYSTSPDENELTYSPGYSIVRPEELQSFNIQSDWNYDNNLNLKLEFAQSIQDLNSLSNLDDDDNFGMAYYLEIEKKSDLFLHENALNIHFSDWKKSIEFASLSRDTDILFNREWNLSNEQNGVFRLKKGDITVNLPKSGISTIQFSSLLYGTDQKERFYLKHNVVNKIFKDSYYSYNSVMTQGHSFLQQSAYLSISSEGMHPYLQYVSELDEHYKLFETSSFGIKKIKQQNEWNIKVSHRIDAMELDSLLIGLEDLQEGWFLEGDLSSNSSQGWRKDFTIRKRMQNDISSRNDINYTLGQAQLSYGNNRHPVRWDFQLNSEETYKENRIVVYDSIGPGLGYYRYDKNFNDYIEDENGSYIAQTVSSGQLSQSSSLSGSHRFQYDMSKEKSFWKIPLSIHIENRLDYSGNEQNIESLLLPTIENQNIIRSRWNNRLKLDYNPIMEKIRIQSWQNTSRDMNGMDPRGNDIRQSNETVFMFENNRSKEWKLFNKSQWTLFKVESEISSLRNREINGWWSEFVLTRKLNVNTNYALSIHGGQGNGSYGIVPIKADGTGISIEGKTYISKKGRLESKLIWNNINLKSGNVLPPEALMGNPVGNGLRTQTRFQWIIDSQLSLNISLITIRDSRYGSLITFNGEFRAYF